MPASTAQLAPASDETLTLTTRFGDVTLRADRLLNFEHGLFGFAECTSFGLAQVPGMVNSPLLLMVCTQKPEVTFVVADPAKFGIGFEPGDVEAALEELNFPASDTQVLVILTIYKTDETASITANLRAPVFIDTEGRRGVQGIMANPSYNTQHKI